MSLPQRVVGWCLVLASSSGGGGWVWVGLWSVSRLRRGYGLSVVFVFFSRGWYEVLASSSQGLWVEMSSVSLPRVVVGWSVSIPRWGCGLVCGLCLFLAGLWVGLWSLHLPRWGYGSICSLCLFLARLLVGLRLFLASVVGCSVVCVSSSPGLWVDPWSTSLQRGDRGMVCCPFFAVVVGWFVVCISSSRVCISSSRGLWVDLWSVSLPRVVVSWCVPLPRQGCGLVCGMCESSSPGLWVGL